MCNSMESQLIIDVKKQENVIALLEDEKLVEMQREPRSTDCSLDDIFVGKVSKVDPGLNAAFINIGTDKDAFIHYNELGPSFGATQNLLKIISSGKTAPSIDAIPRGEELPKGGQIEDVLKKGQRIVVQVSKEKINTKGATVTTELSIAGRAMVLVPFFEGVSVSQKITDKFERERLINLVTAIKPPGFKVVVRTFAQGKTVADLDIELNILLTAWQDAVSHLSSSRQPQRIYAEPDRTICLLRDSFDETYKKIVVNNKELYADVLRFVNRITQRKAEEIVSFYEPEKPIFDAFGITRQIKSLFGRTVTYQSGAYLVIEPTEAMHVIDVNSGTRSRKSSAQEDTAFDVNMSAAVEIARQLRLRDMGGIIVIDFIDMDDPQHRKELYNKMVELMQGDKATHTILPLSKFCVMQITRQRVRPAVTVSTEERCPTCLGTGKTAPSILLTDQIEERVAHLSQHGYHSKKLWLHLHPFVAAYLTRRSLFGQAAISRWKSKYNIGLKVVEDESLPLLDFRFFDSEREEIFRNPK